MMRTLTLTLTPTLTLTLTLTLISQREKDLMRMFSGLRSQWIRSNPCTKRSASRHCVRAGVRVRVRVRVTLT